MRKCLYLFLGFIFLASCSSPINIVKFQTTDRTIEKGNQTYLEWEVQNADKIVLKQQGYDKPILESTELNDGMLVSPAFTTTYFLYAYQKDDVSRAQCDLAVIKKTIEKDTSKFEPNIIDSNTISDEDTNILELIDKETYEVPLVDKSIISNKLSQTVVGMMPIDSATKNTKLIYEIFYIDQSDYPNEVKLYVTVKDQFGNFISNLAPPYGSKETAKKFFLNLVEVVEHKNYPLSYFDVEERHDSLSQGYNFSLVLDHSGSMDANINTLHNSVNEFINAIGGNDESSIIKFDTYIEKTVPMTNDKDILSDAAIYNGLVGFGGCTALIAAADEGIRSFPESETSKIEILFTDGRENSSFATACVSPKPLAFLPSQLIQNARKDNVKILTIGFGDTDKNLLERISEYTDGKSYYADNNNEITQIFNELPRLFHDYYLITYKPEEMYGMHELTLTCGNIDGSRGNIGRNYFVGPIPDDTMSMNMQRIANFDLDKDVVRERDFYAIVRVANFLAKNPKATISFYGHTDMRGMPIDNMDLARRRAENVTKKFNQLGIKMDRMTLVSMGMSEPIYNPEMDDYQSEENRRVDFTIKF